MENKNTRASKQQRELDRQLDVIMAYGSSGFGLMNIGKPNIESQEIEFEIEHLTE